MKKYFITGISSGLGRAPTKKLAGNGDFVWGIARRGQLLRELAKELNSAKFIYSELDISKKDSWNLLISNMKRKSFVPDVVVLNAAVLKSISLRKIFEINFFANISAVKSFIFNFPNKKIHFILISSSSAFKGSEKEDLGYGASKAALSLVFESYSRNFEGTNFKFSTVFFGPIKAGMNPNPRNLFAIKIDKAISCILRVVESGSPYVYYPFWGVRLILLTRFFPPQISIKIFRLLEKLNKLGS